VRNVGFIVVVFAFFALLSMNLSLYGGEGTSSSNHKIAGNNFIGHESAQTSLPLRVEGELEPPAAYGLAQLEKALALRDVRLELNSEGGNGRGVRVGVAALGSTLASWVKAGKLSLADTREALAVKRIRDGQNEVLTFAGADAVGLMYALLEATEEVEALPAGADWFPAIREVSEKPANSMRRMRVLLHHEANEREWYSSIEYWDWYLDMLARNRFNGLNLVFSHQSSYMAPMYAWHVKVPEFPNVRGKGLTEEQRLANLEALKAIARMCKERGIEFTIGIWQQLPWIQKFVKSREDQPIYVEGLDERNVREYTPLAIKELLRQVPGIARLQLRMNDESGIPMDMQTAFYRDIVMKAIAEASPSIQIDLRMAGAREATIEAARQMNRGMRVGIKFYGEFMGQPYTPVETVTHGYSYDERLRRPFKNPVYNEVWVLGSHRVYLWGSEDYGRRFGRNASYAGTIGFETDGPLAQKGYRDPYSPAWRIFKNKADEYYRWEIERYWAFFRSVGRFGYDPEADHDVWMRPFRARFGNAANALAKAYEDASRVIGLVVASHINNINMYVWPEKSMGGVLGAYLDLRGSDKGYFPSINDQVAEELAGTLTGRPGPDGLAREYESVADGIDKILVSGAFGGLESNKEFLSTRADFTMLAHLARYHGHRQRECYRMARFFATGDVGETRVAQAEAKLAVEEWRFLVALTDRWYYDHMQFAPVENGHWKDSLFLVEKEPLLVRDAVETLQTYGLFNYGFDFGQRPMAANTNIFRFWKYMNSYDMEPRFLGLSSQSRYSVQTSYGWVDNEGLKETPMPALLARQLSGEDPSPENGLPRNALYSDFVSSLKPFCFRVDLPMESHRFTLIFADRSEKPRDHGPLIARFGTSRSSTFQEGIKIPAGKVIHYQTDRNLRTNWYPFELITVEPSKEGADAMLSGLVVSAMKPRLGHAPIARLNPREDAELSVTITMPPEPVASGALSASSAGRLAEASLLWRTDASKEWKRQPLKTEDGFVYTALLPAGTLTGRWIEYAFQATDQTGHTSRLPEAREQKTFTARLTADSAAPSITHSAITSAQPGHPITLRAKVSDPDGVAVVRVYFRPLADNRPYECLELEKRGDEYIGTIPGEIIVPEFEFIYYLEAVDEAGNGRFFPDWKTATPYIIVPVKR
jgi:hypothetical protein